MPKPRRFLPLLTGLSAVALLVGCSLPAPMLQGGHQVEDDTPAETPDELEEFYTQEIAWENCGSDLECGTVTVPVDYSDPDGDTIDLALNKYATSSAAGAVLINPGGPGGSGVELVESATQVFTQELREAKEIIGFDPRGVGGSAPITCYDGEQLDELYSTNYDIDTESGWEEFLEDTQAYTDACVEENPEVIQHVDTVSAAKDMDIIRAALDENQLDYLGFSYGTKLGATYADLFGDNVGRFVLDAAMDLSLDDYDLTLGQVKGFEQAFRVFLEDCIESEDCVFSGTVDEAYDDTLLMLEQLAERPLEVDDSDRPVTDSDLFNAIILPLYSMENWPLLANALSGVYEGNGEMVRFLSDYSQEREDDGTYAPGDGAMMAISCLDEPYHGELDRDELSEREGEWEEISPLFGPALAYTEAQCAFFPFKDGPGPTVLQAPDAPTMVVVGTTGDPATPYEWAEAMVEQFDDAVLLTWEGEGHVAYGNGSCIDEAVDRYLIDGVVPEDGLRC